MAAVAQSAGPRERPNDSPLPHLTVVARGSRPVIVAAAWLAELGADVWIDAASLLELAPSDRAWLCGALRTLNPPPSPDITLTDGPHTAQPAGTRVRLFGSAPDGPWQGRPLAETEIAAATGVAIAIGEPDRAPLSPPNGLMDAMVGVHLATAALAGRLRGARGVEVVAAEAIATSVVVNANLYEPFGRPWLRAGRRASCSGGTYPYSLFDVSDGQVCLIGRTRADFSAVLTAAGNPGWAQDARFADPERVGRFHADEVDERLRPWLLSRERADILEAAAHHGFPAGPVLTPTEVLDDPVIEPTWHEASAEGRQVRSPGAPFTSLPRGIGLDRPLQDCIVLDLAWVWSGPGVSAALADLGATVIKIESRTRPDNTRLRTGLPPGRVPPEAPPIETSPYFHGINRGKQSITLDLKTEEGRATLQRLAAQADVLVENLSPGVMTRLGVDPDQLGAINPGCIHVSLRGFRDHELTRGRRAYAPVLSSAAGIESLVAYPGETPIGMMTYGYSDANAVIQGLSLALAGLLRRRATGRGSVNTLYQHDGAVWANGHNLLAAQFPGGPEHPQPVGADEAVSFDALPQSPAIGRDLILELPHRWLGTVQVAGLPWKLDGVRPAPSQPGPAIGQHTRSVLQEHADLAPDAVDELGRIGALT